MDMYVFMIHEQCFHELHMNSVLLEHCLNKNAYVLCCAFFTLSG
jgi:hypothetical protein